MRSLRFGFLPVLLLALTIACSGEGTGDDPGGDGDGDGDPVNDCGDNDPLTAEGWAGFCADRVDDNCTQDVTTDCLDGSHDLCETSDEPCPATSAASAAPDWDCTGTPPGNVIAYAHFDTPNQQVSEFCTFVYESSDVAGTFYAAISMTDGPANSGPPHPGGGNYCQADFSARRHLWYSDLDSGDCPGVKYIHAYPNENNGMLYPTNLQKLSNSCRKMIRNVQSAANNDPTFNPDIQYFAASRSEADAKLAVLDTAEIGCVGIDNINNMPYRSHEEWISQASAPLQSTGN